MKFRGSRDEILRAVAMMLVCGAPVHAQFGRRVAEWMTDGSDPQRSHSIAADPKISPEAMREPGFQLLWRIKLDNKSVQLNSLTPAMLLDRYIGYRGFRSLAFLSGSSNMVFGIDTDLSRLEWQQKLSDAPVEQRSAACPGGVTSNVARSLSPAYPPPSAGGGGLGGRGGPAKSAVGAPDEGAVTLAAAVRPPAYPPAPRIPAGARNTFNRVQTVFAIASDGKLHSLYVSNGMEPEAPLEFLPPDANARGLIVLDGIAYAASENCNGNASAVWALDTKTKTVAKWQPPAGAIAGSVGPAFGPSGEVYVTTTAGDLVALESKTLAFTGKYSVPGKSFSSSPVVFPYRGKDLIAAATSDGRIHVVDAATFSTPNAKALAVSAPDSSAGGFAPGALATWQATDGTRWLLAAAQGAVSAWKLVRHNDALSLEPGWRSPALVSPLTPVVINGVVFAVSSGEAKDPGQPVAERAKRSSPAVIYALDGTTGRVLWDSGKTITSFVHSGGISGGAGQIYLETWDHYLYAFGYPMEH